MSSGAFAGFPAEAFEWFAGLEADNTREWFGAHRDTYEEAVRGPLEAMLFDLAAELGGEVKVFRQHRDVRFSPDKSPYKTRTYGVVFAAPAPLYAQVDREGMFAGTGYHMLDSAQLERFRAAAADDTTGPALEPRSRRPGRAASRRSARCSRPRRAAGRATIPASRCCATRRCSAALGWRPRRTGSPPPRRSVTPARCGRRARR